MMERQLQQQEELIVPFGPSFPGQKGIGHQPNEWMNIDDIITNAKIYALSLYHLAKGE